MKILYDHLCYSEFYGGVSRYFTEVIKRLPKEIEYRIPLKYTNNEYFKTLELPYKTFFPNKHFKGQCSLINLLNTRYTKIEARKGNYDIYHQTHYDTFAFDLLPKTTKKVITIHDLNFFAIPQFYSKKNRLKEMQVDSIKRCDFIITVSDNTKKDLIRFFNIPETKIKVIYHGITMPNIEYKVFPYKLDKPYILFVGSRYVYKNFVNTVRAFAKINHNHDFYLVCTGTPFSKEEFTLLNELNIQDSVKQIRADDRLLNSLYAGAEVFIYPSYYEGFGIPLLEAMCNNCPILCSDSSCFPEIAEDAAIYFNPYSVNDIVEKMQFILNNETEKKKIVENGNNRMNFFSWEKSSALHYETYKMLLS